MKNKTKDILVCAHGRYRLYRRNDVYYLDTRSSTFPSGKISLNTKDHATAVQRAHQADNSLAIRFGVLPAPAFVADAAAVKQLLIEDGWTRYIEHSGRPAMIGGVSEGTLKRYRAVQHKHREFARQHHIATWQQVDDRHVVAYATHLTQQGYSDNTIVLEVDLIKSIVKLLITKQILPATAKINYATQKSEDSNRYCFTREEATAMLELCWADTNLHWLHDVILFLTLTGARVGELRKLAWSQIDLRSSVIHFIDNRNSALAKKVGAVRTTKGKRGRRVPIHPLLETMLKRRFEQRGEDHRVFRGQLGGEVNPDGVLVALKRDVIKPLAARFPTPPGEIGFEHGTVHGLRHTFVSQAFLAGANESEIGDWVGHKSSRITRRYRHLGQPDSIRRMRQLDLITVPTPPAPDDATPNVNKEVPMTPPA